jgi:adenine/guanine phosphoribosyltransferase-like PRPP-binding protein
MSASTDVPTCDLTGWAAQELGLTVELAGDATLADLDALAGLALRRNPKRAHLLVSRVLGKHLPVDPALALDSGAALAARVRLVTAEPALVLGFAETATALGHAAAAALPAATCVLSTRRPGVSTITFAEEHSHAVGHRVLAPAALLADPRPVVLVDDELSSGRTAVNTIRALHRRYPHPAYVVAALLDMRPEAARADFARLADELGVPVTAVSLLRGEVHVPADAPRRVADRVAQADLPLQLDPVWPLTPVAAQWPAGTALGARSGWDAADEASLQEATARLAEQLLAGVLPPAAERLLVLGTEELMYAPMRLAAALAGARGGSGGSGEVRYQSTTRSPVAPIDRPGYAIRCALTFAAPDEPDRAGYVYNVRPGAADHIVVVTDGGASGPMLDALRGCAPVTEVLLRDEVGA